MTEAEFKFKKFNRLVIKRLSRSIGHWRTTNDDAYGIANAVQVALCEVRTAIIETICEIEEADKKEADNLAAVTPCRKPH